MILLCRDLNGIRVAMRGLVFGMVNLRGGAGGSMMLYDPN
jgi:hypothetical protein